MSYFFQLYLILQLHVYVSRFDGKGTVEKFLVTTWPKRSASSGWSHTSRREHGQWLNAAARHAVPWAPEWSHCTLLRAGWVRLEDDCEDFQPGLGEMLLLKETISFYDELTCHTCDQIGQNNHDLTAFVNTESKRKNKRCLRLFCLAVRE